MTYVIALIYKFLRIFISFTFDQTWLILAIIAAICCDLSIIFTVLFSRIYLGKAYDCFALIFACTLIGMSEEGLVFYSDIISLWTIPCFFFLVALVINEKRIKIQFIEYMLMGGVLGIGGWLKPQVIICFIALMCYLIVSNGVLRKKVYIFFTVGIILLFTKNSLNFLSVNWYQKSISDKIENEKQFMEDNCFPMLHWMNLGMNYESLGAYNLEDVNNTEKIVGIDNKNDYLKNSIKNRIMSHSLTEWLTFINNKIVYSLQNGTYSAKKIWKEKPMNNRNWAKNVQNYIDPANEFYFNHLGIWVQCVYYLCFAGLIKTSRDNKRRIKENDAVQYIGEIALIGVVLFLTLFEQNIRYFYSFIPLVIVLGIKGVIQYNFRKQN